MKESLLPDPPNILSHEGFVFNLSRRIGEGGFARCYEATESFSGRRFAVKAIHADAITKLRAKNKLIHEIDIHRHLDHRHIVKLYRVFHDENFVYLILELCEKQTLVELLRQRKTLTESEVRHYIWMVLAAVHYLHQNNIIHRDLKLGNVFLNLECDVKIGDFGLATTLDQIGDRKKTICGTPNYIAPEILFDKERGHSFEVDVWSIGVIMYSLLFGRPPFQNSDIKIIYKNIKENSYSFPPNMPVSDSAKNIISFLLTSDPDKRPKIESIVEHEFFKVVIIKEPSMPEIDSIRKFCTALSMKPVRKLDVPLNSPKCSSKENIPPGNFLCKPLMNKISLGKKLSAVETAYISLSKHLNRGASMMEIDYIESKPELLPPKFYIEKWLDYTDKYGLGYFCSNGNVGAYFNDSTSIILNPITKDIEYQYQGFHGNQRQMIRTHFTLDTFPDDLSKKITIIKHFLAYFTKFLDTLNMTYDSNSNMEFVLKFAKVNDALILRLSNRTLQAIFYDQTTVILSHDGAVVTFIDKASSFQGTFYLSEVIKLKEHKKLIAKLEIFRDMLDNLLTVQAVTSDNAKPA